MRPSSLTGCILIRHGKNDKDRTIPLTEVRSQQLKDYIHQVRPAFVQSTSPPNLFLSELGRPLHPCTIRDKVRLHARRAGIQRVGANSFCHRFG